MNRRQRRQAARLQRSFTILPPQDPRKWLEAVEADPTLGPEAKAVARVIAARAGAEGVTTVEIES